MDLWVAMWRLSQTVKSLETQKILRLGFGSIAKVHSQFLLRISQELVWLISLKALMYNFSTPNIEPHQNICGVYLLKIQPEELPLQVGLFSVVPTLPV